MKTLSDKNKVGLWVDIRDALTFRDSAFKPPNIHNYPVSTLLRKLQTLPKNTTIGVVYDLAHEKDLDTLDTYGFSAGYDFQKILYTSLIGEQK